MSAEKLAFIDDAPRAKAKTGVPGMYVRCPIEVAFATREYAHAINTWSADSACHCIQLVRVSFVQETSSTSIDAVFAECSPDFLFSKRKTCRNVANSRRLQDRSACSVHCKNTSPILTTCSVDKPTSDSRIRDKIDLPLVFGASDVRSQRLIHRSSTALLQAQNKSRETYRDA